MSSTAIRAALAAGDVASANELLGRPYEVRGIVEHGDASGAGARLSDRQHRRPRGHLLPADGIYAGVVRAPVGRGRARRRIARVAGPRSTKSQPFRLLEVHLLDCDGDLYGEQAKVSFVARLREEMKFDSRDALVDQMHRDCEDALRLLAG